MNTNTKKKTKRLTNEQKVAIYEGIENEGLFDVLVEGYLDTEVKGTKLAPLFKVFKKTVKSIEATLKANGIGAGDFENVEQLRTKMNSGPTTGASA